MGAGVAGLSAARAAAQLGARVMLLDEQNQAGGSALYNRAEIAGQTADIWALKEIDALRGLPNVADQSPGYSSGELKRAFHRSTITRREIHVVKL